MPTRPASPQTPPVPPVETRERRREAIEAKLPQAARDSRALVWSLGALLLSVGIYAPILVELGRDWIRDPNYSHGMLIPVISGYLVWRQRQRLRDLPIRPANIGIIGVLGALALLVVGAAASEVFTQRVSLLALLFSTVVFTLGWSWARVVAFPLTLMLLAIPLPYILYYSVTSPMQAVAAKMAVFGLKALGVPLLAQGNVIHLESTSLEVAEACSGIRSLYAFLALGALLAYAMSIPTWARLLVFLVTIPLSVVANAVRVSFTALGVHLAGPWVAEGFVHEFFGLIMFASTLVLFILIRKGAHRLWSSAASS